MAPDPQGCSGWSGRRRRIFHVAQPTLVLVMGGARPVATLWLFYHHGDHSAGWEALTSWHCRCPPFRLFESVSHVTLWPVSSRCKTSHASLVRYMLESRNGYQDSKGLGGPLTVASRVFSRVAIATKHIPFCLFWETAHIFVTCFLLRYPLIAA